MVTFFDAVNVYNNMNQNNLETVLSKKIQQQAEYIVELEKILIDLYKKFEAEKLDFYPLVKEIEEKITVLQNLYQAAVFENEYKTKQYQELLEVCNSYRKEAQEFENEKSSLLFEIEELQLEIENLKSLNSDKYVDTESLKYEMKALQCNKDYLYDKCKKLEKEVEETDNHLNIAQNEIRVILNENSDLRLEVEDLREESAKLRNLLRNSKKVQSKPQLNQDEEMDWQKLYKEYYEELKIEKADKLNYNHPSTDLWG